MFEGVGAGREADHQGLMSDVEQCQKELKRELDRFKKGLADASEVSERIDELIQAWVERLMTERLGERSIIQEK